MPGIRYAETTPVVAARSPWPARISRAAGGASALLGLVVLIGWYTHSLPLLRVYPTFVAMAFNAALGFLLCGVGLLALALKRPRLAAASGGLSLVLGLLTLSEYLSGRDLGIDQLLMREYVRAGILNSGRMAFCSALCFTLAGAAVLLRLPGKRPGNPAVPGLLGALVAGLGVVAFSGYFTGIASGYAWGQLTRMAVHTALGFLVLGLGIIALAWQDSPGRLPRWTPGLVGVGFATATLCLWQALIVAQATASDLIQRLAAANGSLRLDSLSRTQSLLANGTLAGGLLLAMLLGLAVLLAQTLQRRAEELSQAQHGLEVRVEERTAELADANQALQEAAQRQRAFLRDVLASVTEGRLRLCDRPDDLPAPLLPVGEPVLLSATGGLRALRCLAREAAVAQGFADERWQDLVTAASEAAMNAIVHAGGGQGRVCSSPDRIQVWVEDQGAGIDVAHLPRATLEKGFTTAGTLGHGMKMMLQTADHVYLLTGASGTSIVLEQDRMAALPSW